MRYYSFLLFTFAVFWFGCQRAISYTDVTDSSPSDPIFLVFADPDPEWGTPCGYVNAKGDTIIPVGTYDYCFLDTVTTYAIVATKGSKGFEPFAVDQHGNRLFEVYWYDNGPDYLSEGLFRVKRKDKIGYADARGQLVIPVQFECATPFRGGKAKVSLKCKEQPSGGHIQMVSEEWFFIDPAGKRIE